MAPAVSDLFQLIVDLAIPNLKLRLYSSFPNARKRNVTTSRCSGHMGQRNVVSSFVILDPAVISTNVWVFLMIFFSTQKKQHQNSIIIFCYFYHVTTNQNSVTIFMIKRKFTNEFSSFQINIDWVFSFFIYIFSL